MKKPILLLILLSLSYASLIWQYSTDGPVYAKPVIFQGMLIAASDDGNIYAVDPSSGAKRWQAVAGLEPNEVFVFDNGVVASTTGGKVVKIGSAGNTIWQLNLNTTAYNASYVYGASANLNRIFVTADNGVYVIEKNGSVKAKIANFNNTLLTAPVAGPDYVIYGKDKELIKAGENGQILWRAKLDEGAFWLSRPIIEGGVIYVGALDNKLHAYVASNGLEMWEARAKGWVVGTPLVRSGTAYFGSNDGRVYAVDSGSGGTIWTAQTALAIQSQPEAGTMGGQESIFVGGTDKSIYAISQGTGEIVWKGSAGGAAGSPLFYQNEVIFGSADGKISAYSTERACSITTPTEAQVIGTKEVVVNGKYASEAGNAMVMVQINSGEWKEANTSETGWIYYIDPKSSFSTGLNIISCKVADAGGEEIGPTFTTVSINHDPTIPLSNLIVTASPDILEGVPFVIYVNDADDGSLVDRFRLTIAGREYSGDKNLTVTIAEPGTYDLKVSKIGFNDADKTVTVNSSGVNPLVVVVGALVIIVVLYQVWTRFLSKKFAKKK